MKNTAWNILAVVALLAMVATAIIYLAIFSNPNSGLNPFPPPTAPANMVIPTGTATPLRLPATWTPKPLEPTEARVSATAIPSATNFKLITDTPTPTPSEAPPELVILATDTATPYKYFCEISVSKPLDGSPVDFGSNFDGRWEIKNLGTDTWANTQVQARYITGTKLQTKTDFLNLPRDVEPGASVSLTLDMTAPSEVGTFYATWGLMTEDTVICRWTFAISVPKAPPK
jgi:hypothetical protein